MDVKIIIIDIYAVIFNNDVGNYHSLQENTSNLQENTSNSDGGSDGLQCRRTFVTDFQPNSDENKKFEVVGIPSTISDEYPRKHGSSKNSDDFSTTF